MGTFYSDKPPIRGTFNERVEKAKKFGIDRIEIPFDLVRLENEEYFLLNKKIGDIPEQGDFKTLYGKEGNGHFAYILHTDPELKPRHYLRWNKKKWRKRYLASIIDFAEFSGRVPFAVEFHPSRKTRSENHFEDFIVDALTMLVDCFECECPYVYVENRTNLYISTIENIIQLYEEISDRTSDRERKRFGFSVDVMQLYSQMGKSVIKELPKIPADAIKNWHIHYRHQPPTYSDPIDWRQVANYIVESQPTLVLPEVFTDQGVRATIEFIESLLD